MSGVFAAWAIETLIATSLLLAFVLLVRRPVRRMLGPQLAYGLWALPALRMALPPLSVPGHEGSTRPIAEAGATVLVILTSAPASAAAAPAAAPAFPWLALSGTVWLLGATLFFAWHASAHFAYVRRIMAPPAIRTRLACGTTLIESAQAVGPVAFGVLRRFVAVPIDFAARWDADERRLALAHELGHHARGDLIANWLALALLALHWWNPLAWRAYRAFRADQEMANDARVLAGLSPVERHAYACAIVKAAHGRAVTAACHFHTIEDLKGRLRMLKANRKSRRVLAAGAIGIGALTVAGLGLTASSAAAEHIRTVAAAQAAPVPPAVEAAPPAPSATEPRRVKRVVVVRDGKTRTFEGAAAAAYLAEHPDTVTPGATTHRQRIVIRTKDGKTETYEGAAADAFLKAHPELRPPEPPVPPAPVVGAVPPPSGVPSPPALTTRRMSFVMRSDGADRQVQVIDMPEIREMTCGTAASKPATMTYDDAAGGKRRLVLCMDRIAALATPRLVNARVNLGMALSGLETGRRAIEANRNLTAAQRAEALAGIASARVELERELRDLKD